MCLCGIKSFQFDKRANNDLYKHKIIKSTEHAFSPQNQSPHVAAEGTDWHRCSWQGQKVTHPLRAACLLADQHRHWPGQSNAWSSAQSCVNWGGAGNLGGPGKQLVPEEQTLSTVQQRMLHDFCGWRPGYISGCGFCWVTYILLCCWRTSTSN